MDRQNVACPRAGTLSSIKGNEALPPGPHDPGEPSQRDAERSVQTATRWRILFTQKVPTGQAAGAATAQPSPGAGGGGDGETLRAAGRCRCPETRVWLAVMAQLCKHAENTTELRAVGGAHTTETISE